MIPDKIYIPLYPNLDTDGFHLGDDWMEKPDSCSKCEHVEYLRKDALLEWARLGLEMLDDDTSPVAQAAKAVFNGLIDKLNSM